MFVRKSRFESLERVAATMADRINTLNMQLNYHKNLVNELRYRLLVAQNRSPTLSSSQFSEEELKQLIRLCHPDKHGGSAAATKITQKLLALRR